MQIFKKMYNLYTEAARETREKNLALLFFCLRVVEYNDISFLRLPFFGRAIETYTTVTHLWRSFQCWSPFCQGTFLIEDTTLSFTQGLAAQIGSTYVKNKSWKEVIWYFDIFFCLKMHKTCFTQSNQSSIGSYSPVFCLQQWPKLNTENNLRIWFTHTCVHTHAEVCMQHLWNFPHLASHMSDDLQLKVFHSQSGIFQQSVWLCKYQSLGINDVIRRDKRPCWCIIHENQKKNVD